MIPAPDHTAEEQSHKKDDDPRDDPKPYLANTFYRRHHGREKDQTPRN